MKVKPERAVIYICRLQSPLGAIEASAENEALTGLWLIGDNHSQVRPDGCSFASDYPLFQALGAWLSDYFCGLNKPPEFKLQLRGTPFQLAVWNLLLQIPFGQVATYGQIARQIDFAQGSTRMSAQAVGGAVGHNPISILIPCHRVVGADRSLTGYAGGLDKKKALLDLEGIDLSTARLNGLNQK